jgi:hypothetical protein
MPDAKESVRVVVLSGTIATTPVDPTPHALRARPSIVESVPSLRVPLDLNASTFRYASIADGVFITLPTPRRRCRTCKA